MEGSGIDIGERAGPSARARIIACDVRNCHYAGIVLPAIGQSPTIEGCRISGAAWHGIRYGSGSPRIAGNLIFGNARSGIYAGGDSTAEVRNNLFYRNEMNGISCWYDNHDVIEENTFAGNLREGVAVLGAAAPVLRRNLFFDHRHAIVQGRIGGDPTMALGSPIIERNVFWKNEVNFGGWNETGPLPATLNDSQNAQFDPELIHPARRDFGLTAASPLRAEGIGVRDPLSFESPWPLQPEELAIIPDGDSRDSRLWKDPRRRRVEAPKTLAETGAGPAERPPIALLYDSDPDVRIRTIQALAAADELGFSSQGCVRSLRQIFAPRNVGHP